MKLCIIIVAVGVGAGATDVGAQPAPQAAEVPGCSSLIAAVRSADPATARRRAAAALMNMGDHPDCLAEVLTERDAFARFVQAFESHRTDNQAGSSAGTGGTANLVAHGPLRP